MSLGFVLVEWGWRMACIRIRMCVCACVNARKFFVAVLFVVGKKHVDKCGNYSIPCSLRINAPLIDDCINL
jgi:hypothetical protein